MRGSLKSVWRMVEGEGFEPSNAYAGRFTVCCLWPLGNPSKILLRKSNAAHSTTVLLLYQVGITSLSVNLGTSTFYYFSYLAKHIAPPIPPIRGRCRKSQAFLRNADRFVNNKLALLKNKKRTTNEMRKNKNFDTLLLTYIYQRT